MILAPRVVPRRQCRGTRDRFPAGQFWSANHHANVCATLDGMPLVGYARVSTADQDCTTQVDALTAVGCIKVFPETASGVTRERPVLAQLLDYLRLGDTLVVWKLDRLGRSIRHLIEVVTSLAERGIGFRSLTEGFDTTTPGGKLIFHVLGSLAEFERDLIRERTMAGLATARAAGRVGGRRPKLTERQLAQARKMHTDGETITSIAEVLTVARSTVYRALMPLPREA